MIKLFSSECDVCAAVCQISMEHIMIRIICGPKAEVLGINNSIGGLSVECRVHVCWYCLWSFLHGCVFSVNIDFPSVPYQIEHEMQGTSLSLVSPLQAHTEDLPAGSSLHLWFTWVRSPRNVKQLLQSRDCSCCAWATGACLGDPVAVAANLSTPLPAAGQDTL